MKKRVFGKLYKELFYIPKHEKLTEKVFRCRMITSVLTMLACTAVLITSTWAWFNMSVTTQPSTIETAYYSVTVDNAENGVYICPLTYEDKHTFEIEAGGTATTGYCKIQVGEQSYYTEQIPQGSSLLLTVQAARGTVITFTSQWGSTNELPCENEIIHSVTPSATYTIEATATLDDISAYYGVSVADIVTYNGTVDMTAGNVLKIPGVDPNTASYVAPVPEAALLTESDSDFVLTSNSTIPLSNADILIYKGMEYQNGLDLRITGLDSVADINNKTGEYFCTLITNTETLSLCLENTANIENGYLKIIIGENEYYTVRIKKNGYIRLDIVASIGTEIRFEAYEGVPIADILYGDDLKDDTDGNDPLLDHTWLTTPKTETPVQTEQPTQELTDPATEPTEPKNEDTPDSGDDTTPTEQPPVETPIEEPAPTEETPVTEQPTEETSEPEDTTSDGEDNGSKQPAEDPAPTGDDVPAEDGATE